MANQNIEMKHLNGSGTYDTLYPKTLSTNTIISDETATEMGLESGATVDEALGAIKSYIQSYIEPIGTIKTTMRSDLSDNWLLCDGSEIERGAYSELDIMLDDCLNSRFYDKEFIDVVDSATINYVSCENNTVIIIYSISSVPYIAFRNVNESVWEHHELPTALNLYSKIRWLKDKYVAIQSSYRLTSTTDYLYYSTDLKTWSPFQITCSNFSGGANVYLVDIIYANGNYMLSAQRTASGSTHTQWIGFSTQLEGAYDFGGESYTSRAYMEIGRPDMRLYHVNDYFFMIYPKSTDKYQFWYVNSSNPLHTAMKNQTLTLDTTDIDHYNDSNIVYLNEKYYFARSRDLYCFTLSGTFSKVVAAPDGYNGFIKTLWADETTANIFLCGGSYVGMISGLSSDTTPNFNYFVFEDFTDIPPEMERSGGSSPKSIINNKGVLVANILYLKQTTDEVVTNYRQIGFYQFRGLYSKQLPLSLNNDAFKTYIRIY